MSMTFFTLLHKKRVIYHTKFPTFLFSNYFTHKILPFTHSLLLFPLVSPLEMVSPGTARPLRPRLSTPLDGCSIGNVDLWHFLVVFQVLFVVDRMSTPFTALKKKPIRPMIFLLMLKLSGHSAISL